MIKDYDYYRKLITSEYRYAPKYNETIKKLVNYGLGIDAAVDKMIEVFEVNNAGTDQLDKIGSIVGVSRDLKFTPSTMASGEIICPAPSEMSPEDEFEKIYTPIPSRMKGTQFLSGMAPDFMDVGNIVDDDTYRTIIKARIIQNSWKGKIPELYELWSSVFGEDKILSIQDLQDMSYNIVLQGNINQLERELIANGYIVPKPEGVRINIITFVSSEGLPLFSYDYNTMTYSGYGSHWVEEE